MIDNELYLEIVQYCQLNDITNIEKEINSMLRKGFSIVKYGSSPFEKMREQQNLPIQDDVSESKEVKKRTYKRKPKEIKETETVTSEVEENINKVEQQKVDEVKIEEPIKKRKVRVIKNK